MNFAIHSLAAALVAALSNTPHAEPDSPALRIQHSILPAQYLEGRLQARSIPQAMLEADIPGLSLAFVDNGEIVWRLTYGYADLENAVPVTPETVFSAASLSKPVAAMTALHLVDQGLLELDGDVNAYLQGWRIPDNAYTVENPVTLRHLIGHTAGVNNFLTASFDLDAPMPTVEQMLTATGPSVDPVVELEATPGERYRYSNPGYTIIQKLIQDVSGEPYAEAAGRIIFEPAGMQNSALDQPLPQALRAQAAIGYSNDLEAIEKKQYPFLAAGGLRTTATDLALFLGTLMTDRSDGTERILTQERADEVFAPVSQRLGFTNTPGPDSGDVMFEHWGSVSGFTSYMIGHLPENQALVIMANSDNGFNTMAMIAHAVAREYGWGQMEPTVYQAAEMSLERLSLFTGAFGGEDASRAEFTFVLEETGLVVREPGREEAFELIPVAESTFIAPDDNTIYEFLEARDGAFRWVRMTRESGYNSDYPKH